VILVCPECKSVLTSNLRCQCGYAGMYIDGIPVLVPPGCAAIHNDSNPIVRRLGGRWKRLLRDVGEQQFVETLVAARPQVVRHRTPVSKRQLLRARRLSDPVRVQRHPCPSHEPDEPIEWIVQQVSALEPPITFDVATGGGFLLGGLAHVIPVPQEGLIALDKDFVCLSVARTRCALIGVEPAFVVADLKAIPLPDNYCDCITSNFGFYHIEDYAIAIREVARVLRIGGRLLACEMDHTRLVPDLSETANMKIAREVHLYGRVGNLLGELRSCGLLILHDRRRKRKDFRWREICVEKV
jgi:SAM-dependent methyltransferase